MSSHRVSLRRCCLRTCILSLALCGFATAFAQSEAGLTFQRALDIAVQRAPMISARKASADGAAAARTSAGRLPDPRLNLGVSNVPITGEDRFSLTDDFMTMSQIGWMQEVPNRAKRAAQRDAAAALAEREQALLASERQTVRRRAALAWLERHYAERQLALFSELERENQVLQQTVNARIAAGSALPADASMARQEAIQIAARRDELERGHAQAQAALKRWVGDAAEVPLAGPPTLPALRAEHLRENLAHHVELAAFDPMLRMAAAETREAHAGKKSDWAWEVMYGKRGSQFDDMVSVQVSVQLPLFTGTRRDPQIYAKAQAEARIQAEREEMLREHAQMIDSQLAEQEALASQLARVAGQALPLADERVRLTIASYAAGRADLGAVLAARRERLETRLLAIELEGRLDALRAQLAYLFTEDRR
jgi:outer membrane protein, heavy metal efflux system